MNAKFNEVRGLTSIAAIFVRGFMQAFENGEETLRGCQDGGRILVEELGSEISLPYISKLSRLLDDARIITRKKHGRSYRVTDDELCLDFLNFLNAEADYGGRLRGTEEQDYQRNEAWEHLEQYGSLRSTADSRIPPAAYKMLVSMVREGKLDMIFVEAGLPAGVKFHGETVRCRTLDG